MHFTIKTKIFLGTVAVSLIFILISMLAMNRFIEKMAYNEVLYNLRTGKRAYERFTALRNNLIISQARSIAQTPLLKAVINISDVDGATVFHTAQELYGVSEISLMLLIDDQGKLLADVDDPLFFGHDLRGFPGVEAGLKGAEFNGIWRYRDNLYRAALTPIVLEDQILGLLILGDLLTRSGMDIREFTGRDVLILHSGKIIVQSREHPESSLITQNEIVTLVNSLEKTEASNASPVSPFRAILGGKACLAVAIAFVNSDGYTVLFRALEEAESGVDVLRILVLGAGGLSIILAVILSLWLSARVSRPIQNLRDVAEQFGAGRLEKRVMVHSKDELGQLGETFNRMAEALQNEITERRQAEAVLTQSEERYRAVVNQSTDCIFLVDVETRRILEANPAMQRLLEYTSDEISGLTLYDFVIHEREDIDEKIRRIITTHDHFPGERRYRRKDGTIVDVEVNGNLIAYGDKEMMCVVSRDITERKQTEERLHESNRLLEETLVELQQTQHHIIQQERLRALGQMASGIAHDFNNALSPILGFSDVLLMRPEDLDDKQKAIRYLQIMNTAATDAANVVSRLREFYRHREADEIFSPVNLTRLVEDAIPLTQPRWKDQAQGKGITIQMETDLQKMPWIAGNEAELREMLTNLIFNAVDAMSEDGTITLRTVSDNQQVLLEISDTGSGMTEEVRQRCLEPFFSTKGAQGTGLGLSMVFGIIQRHDGAIEIESEPGQGTTFRIRLPIQTQASSQRDAIKSDPNINRPLHILFVDDEPSVCQMAAAYLTGDGHTVEMAANGREGLEKFSQQQKTFDAVVTDRAMPTMNGDQLAAAIKQLAPTMPIIMLTGFGEMMGAAGEKLAGVDLIVNKPVTLEVFREALVQATRD